MWSVVGHDRIVATLARRLEAGQTSHAYLFDGPAGIGKMRLALNVAQALNCVEDGKPCGSCGQCHRIAGGKHADVQIIGVLRDSEGPVRKVITIEQIKEFQQAAGLQPYEGVQRVFIIDGAEHLSQDAANRLLKTLEEPPSAVCLILLTAEEHAVLPTILSRCQGYHLRPVPKEVIEGHLASVWDVEPDRARLLARLADGSIGWAIAAAGDEQVLDALFERVDQALEIPGLSTHQRLAAAGRLANDFTRRRDEVFGWLDTVRRCWRDALLVKGGQSGSVINADRIESLEAMASGLSSAQIADALRQVHATSERLQKNVNPRLALDVLMLSLPALSRADGTS